MLTGTYAAFHRAIAGPIPTTRIFHDELRTLAYGTDASFYRLIPEVIAVVESENDLKSVLTAARASRRPVTFRAAGTSLSGQAITDGVLSARQKELIALAIGVTQRCSGCIGFHIKALHKLECTRAELEEMLSVCVYMGGGPALMYTAEAITAWEKMTPVKPG